MKKTVPLSLSLIALATLAACGGMERTTPTVDSQRTGAVGMAQSTGGAYGHVDSITSVVNPDGSWSGRHRLSLRMQDGSVQSVLTRDQAMEIQVGDIVQITRDGQIIP